MEKVRSLLLRKSIEAFQDDVEQSEMKRRLSAIDVIAIGIGEIIGAGIFVITGQAAAEYAGPAISLAFVFSGIACSFAGLCYCELASMIHSSGSAYVYTYAALGEIFAWIIGWDLMLEYMVGAATVAVGWSGYVVNFGEQITGRKIPVAWVTGPWDYSDTVGFSNSGGILNIPAIVVSLFCTVVLVVGIKQSAIVNHLLVGTKLIVILMFLFSTFSYIHPENWKPYIAVPDGVHSYGWGGVFKAATIVFFAYIGFDAVSTVAQETRRPSRDVPIGVLGSLVISTVLYILVGLNLTGIVNFKLLGGHAPLADALQLINLGWMRAIVNVGSIAGLTSVILISLMGQPRVFFAMAYDGLLPSVFAKVHPRFGTPYVPTIVSGIICAVAAGLLPLGILGNMTSAGTLFAFATVSLSTGILRYTRPDVKRGFRVPFGPIIIPALGFILCLTLLVYSGGPTILRIVIWMAIGLIIYATYGYRHSKTRNGILPPSEVAFDATTISKAHSFDSGTDLNMIERNQVKDPDNVNSSYKKTFNSSLRSPHKTYTSVRSIELKDASDNV